MLIAGRVGLPASTVNAVLVRCRINRLSRIERTTGEPLRRYEPDHPDSLIPTDVSKFGNIPDDGRRYVGEQQGKRHRTAAAERTGMRDHCRGPRLGTAYLRTSSTTTPASPTPKAAPMRDRSAGPRDHGRPEHRGGLVVRQGVPSTS